MQKQESIDLTPIIVSGETKTVPVSFTAPRKLRNVVVKISHELLRGSGSPFCYLIQTSDMVPW